MKLQKEQNIAQAEYEKLKVMADNAQLYADYVGPRLLAAKAELVDIKDQIDALQGVTGSEEKLKELEDKKAELEAEISELEVACAEEEGKTKAQKDADNLLIQSQTAKNGLEAKEALLSAAKALLVSVSTDAILQAGGNVILKAGGNIGEPDKFFELQVGKSIKAEANNIRIASYQPLKVSQMSAQNELSLVGNQGIQAAGVTATLTAKTGNLYALGGNIGIETIQLNTAFDSLAAYGNNIYLKNSKNLNADMIMAENQAILNVTGNITQTEDRTAVVAKDLTIRANGDIGSDSTPLQILSENMKLYAGNKVTVELQSENSNVNEAEASDAIILKANNNLTGNRISAAQVIINAAGKIGADDAPVNVETNTITASSKLRQMFIQKKTYIPKKIQDDTKKELVDIFDESVAMRAKITQDMLDESDGIFGTAFSQVTRHKNQNKNQNDESSQDTDGDATGEDVNNEKADSDEKTAEEGSLESIIAAAEAAHEGNMLLIFILMAGGVVAMAGILAFLKKLKTSK